MKADVGPDRDVIITVIVVPIPKVSQGRNSLSTLPPKAGIAANEMHVGVGSRARLIAA